MAATGRPIDAILTQTQQRVLALLFAGEAEHSPSELVRRSGGGSGAPRRRPSVFLGDSLLQDAVTRNIEVMGKAAGRVSAQFAAAHPAVPWRKIAGMRRR